MRQVLLIVGLAVVGLMLLTMVRRARLVSGAASATTAISPPPQPVHTTTAANTGPPAHTPDARPPVATGAPPARTRESYLAQLTAILDRVRTEGLRLRNMAYDKGRESINAARSLFDSSLWPSFREYLKVRAEFDQPWAQSADERTILTLMKDNHVVFYRAQSTVSGIRGRAATDDQLLPFAREGAGIVRNVVGQSARSASRG